MKPAVPYNSQQRLILLHLVRAVEMHLAALEDEMKQPSSPERGRRIARLCNSLEIEKDRARFAKLGLDVDFRTNKRRPNRTAAKREER